MYEYINTMGGVCFTPAASALDAKKKLIGTYFQIRKVAGVMTTAMDAKITLNPQFPNMEWVRSQFLGGGGRWRRRPKRPRRTRRPKPAPTPPAPAPAPAPIPSNPGENTGPTPPNIVNQDPSIYNWGNDRANQVGGSLDRDRQQCPSGGKGVTIFVLDTGCRVTHDEYQGRATTESVRVESGYAPFGDGSDMHGHGTHCAGTAAGAYICMCVGGCCCFGCGRKKLIG